MIAALDRLFIASTASRAWPRVFVLWRRCSDHGTDFMAFKHQPKSAMPNLLLRLSPSANITLKTSSNFSPRETLYWAVIHLGAIIALEMAQQLRARSREVS